MMSEKTRDRINASQSKWWDLAEELAYEVFNHEMQDDPQDLAVILTKKLEQYHED